MMKKQLFSFILIITLCFSTLASCNIPQSPKCSKHIGENICEICGLNYFNELKYIIKAKTPTDSDSFVAVTDSVDCIMKHDEEANSLFVALVYKNIKEKPVLFLLTIKPDTGSFYGWTLHYDGDSVGGTFDAKQVTDIVFEPQVEYNDFSKELFIELNAEYKESVSFCADVLYALLAKENINNLTIQNLGFENYEPSI